MHPATEVLGKLFVDLLEQEHRAPTDAVLVKAVRGEETVNFDISLTKKDGTAVAGAEGGAVLVARSVANSKGITLKRHQIALIGRCLIVRAGRFSFA